MIGWLLTVQEALDLASLNIDSPISGDAKHIMVQVDGTCS